VISERLGWVELEFEDGNLIFNFKDDLSVIKHCKLESALGVS